ncbi:MAG: hypothetical protein KKI20_04535 [Gammaproteobacteria bacterium]|nr:hypothetical protein [Gammaproteobacteria bacterium]
MINLRDIFTIIRSTRRKSDPSRSTWCKDNTKRLVVQIQKEEISKIELGYELRFPSEKDRDTFTLEGSTVTVQICEALRNNKSVTTLDLSNNSLSNEAINAIVDLMKKNPTITIIRLRNCQISGEKKQLLENALEKNLAITSLDLRDNLFNASSPSRPITPASTPSNSGTNSGASTPNSTTSSESTDSTGSSKDLTLQNIHKYLERNRKFSNSLSTSTKTVMNALSAKWTRIPAFAGMTKEEKRKKKDDAIRERKERKDKKRFLKSVRKGNHQNAQRKWLLLSDASKLIIFQQLLQYSNPSKRIETTMLFLLNFTEFNDLIAESNAALLKAKMEIRSGNDDEALQCLDEAISKNPKNAMAYLYRGIYYYRLAPKQQASTNRKENLRKPGLFFRRKDSIKRLDELSVCSSTVSAYTKAYNDFRTAYELGSLGKSCESFALPYLIVSGKKSGKSGLETFTNKARNREFKEINRILTHRKKSDVVPYLHKFPIVRQSA